MQSPWRGVVGRRPDPGSDGGGWWADRTVRLPSAAVPGAWWPTAWMAAFLVVVTGLTTLYSLVDRAAPDVAGSRDETAFHLPTVEQFFGPGPFDLFSTPTATTPGYHLVVAGLTKALGLSGSWFLLVASLFSSFLVLVLYAAARSSRYPVEAVLAVSTVVLSPYFWQATLWLNTDVAALAFTAVVILMLYRECSAQVPRWSTTAVVAAGVFGAAAVRQTSLYLVLPVLVAAVPLLRHTAPGRVALHVAVRVVPAIVLVAVFVVGWGGLTPPDSQDLNAAHPSPVALSFAAALTGLYLLPYLPLEGLGARLRSRSGLACGVVAALPAAIFSSDEDRRGLARTGGWFWTLVDHFPVVEGRSVLLVAGAFVGGLVIRASVRALDAPTVLFLSTLLGLVVSLTAASQMFQRYYELPILALVGIAVVTGWARGDPPPRAVLQLPVVGLQLLALGALVVVPLVT